jgi:hypothetical protein
MPERLHIAAFWLGGKDIGAMPADLSLNPDGPVNLVL